jgi:hypothetical protein
MRFCGHGGTVQRAQRRRRSRLDGLGQRPERQRGSGLAEQDAHDQAAEVELRYDARGYRSAETVQRVDPPVPVERAWQLAGVLDAWVRENGEWIGRVRGDDGRIVWIRGAELRQTKGPDGRMRWTGDPLAGPKSSRIAAES